MCLRSDYDEITVAFARSLSPFFVWNVQMWKTANHFFIFTPSYGTAHYSRRQGKKKKHITQRSQQNCMCWLEIFTCVILTAFLLLLSTHWRIFYVYYYYPEWVCVRSSLGLHIHIYIYIIRTHICVYVVHYTAIAVAVAAAVSRNHIKNYARKHPHGTVQIHPRLYFLIILIMCHAHNTTWYSYKYT